jgi:protein-S-isoprenylcysteine O-methyltransferase Ste14/chorismate mutase
MLEAIGRFVFRRRVLLFPAFFLAALLIAPPRAFGARWWDALAIAGVAFVALGQTLRVITIGLDYVKRGGKKRRIYADRLVTAGVYAHCRNPMYVGNLLVVFGFLLLIGQPWTMAAGAAFFLLAYVSVVRAEEAYLLEHFGKEYHAYCARSPRWTPQVRGLIRTMHAYRFDWPAVIVKEYGTIALTLLGATGVLAWKKQRAGTLQPHLWWFIAAAALWLALFGVARWLKKGRNMKPRGTTLVCDEPTDEQAGGGGLEEHRARIDAIDADILQLLNNRARQVLAVFKIKRRDGLSRVDQARTERILARLEGLNRGPLSNQQVRQLYSEVLWLFAHEFQARAQHSSPAITLAAPAADDGDSVSVPTVVVLSQAGKFA